MPRALRSLPVWLSAPALLLMLAGCGGPKSENAEETASVAKDTKETAGKIPISTSSAEAKALFVEGRDLSEQVRLHDGGQLLKQAVAKDPQFALAHYNLALTAPTPKEFLAHLNEAVGLSDKASEGERLLILSLQAGANADPTKSLQYAEELVAKYPQDERAHLTLGNAYFGQQEYDKAIAELKKATEIAPDYSPAYNSLGYSYRPLGKFAEAEAAFKRYIELVPNDPNPYDSYAELLMKTGRFDESIVQYRKALSVDSNFGNSHVGIAGDLMFQGKHGEAIAEAQKFNDAARNDGDRRAAMLSQTVTYIDWGKTDQALKTMEKQYALGAKIGDTAAMAGDAINLGDILLESGKPDAAAKRYQQALDLLSKSSLSQDVKDDAKVGDHYNLGRVALKRGDLGAASQHAEAYMKGATDRKNDFRIRQAHQLFGMIALQGKKYDEAVSHLGEANQQDPYVIYTAALAYQGKGDSAKAKETAARAAGMNIIPTLNYAFVRTKAKRMA
jgi:tetratricopeptide (TPR) repeat protein